MKSLMMCAALAVAASAVLPVQAALTVTATNGVESLTLAFDAAADARELWCAWDDADKGAGFADWAESERVAIVAADETTLTVARRIPARSSAAPAPSASTRVSTRRPKPPSPSTRSWRIPAR